MNLFRWAAPVYHLLVDPRRSGEDAAVIAARLRQYVPPGGHLLDVGGGTGAIAARLAGSLHARVTVLDASPDMLAHVPRHSALAAVRGAAEHMPFPDGAFDAALVSDAFHHFRDQDTAAREIARVVRPGGGVLILEMDPRGWTRLVVVGEHLLGEPGGFLSPLELRTFLAQRGIDGEWRAEAGASYSILGTVGRTTD
jgi:ubiquinone/menaquinone biosynthesis C-methylase UbiE